jgi:hypothetical protein
VQAYDRLMIIPALNEGTETVLNIAVVSATNEFSISGAATLRIFDDL